MDRKRPLHTLISRDIGEQWSRLPENVVLHYCDGDPASLDAAMTDEIEIIVTDPMPTHASSTRWAGVKWVQLMSAGIDQAIGHPLRRDGTAIASAAGISAVHIAEFVVGRILGHTRRFEHFSRDQRAHIWGDRVALAGPSLRGLRAVIVGYGGVGRETARLLSTFGVSITTVTRDAERRGYSGFVPFVGFGDPEAKIPDRLAATSDLREAVADADVIVLAVPLTPLTRGLLNRHVFAGCRAMPLLINVARGAVVVTDDLMAALDQGLIGHACLDVFEEEPLASTSPLWDHPRVSVTPHMAGVMPDTAIKLETLFLANLERYLTGEALINQLPANE